MATQPNGVEAVAPAPQPPASQPVYAPRPPKVATHPALELSLAIFSVLASAWLLVDALAGSIKLFGNHAPSYDFLTGLLFSHLSSYTGVMIASLGSIMFAGLAFWLFNRLRTAIEQDEYKGILQVGVGIAAIKTLILGVTTIAVGITPLLTIQKGINVGSTYLYDFLPLILGAGVFLGVTWYLTRLMGKQQVGKLLSLILLIATSIVFVLAFVAIIVKSHSSDTSSTRSETQSTSESRDLKSHSWSSDDTGSDSRTDWSTNGSSRSGSTSDTSKCYDEYKESKDLSEYSRCLQGTYNSTDRY